MKIFSFAFALFITLSNLASAQKKPVENEKFVLLNNGATIGMIIKSVMKADKQRLKLSEQQVPKAKEIITTAVVNFNDGVKKLKASGMTNKKLRALAVTVETNKVLAYKAILTPAQYAILAAGHKKTFPESNV
ncbi:hypothetical protein [Spirosoma pulveris]